MFDSTHMGILLLKLFPTLLQVSSLFKDGTIGTDINIVVVSLLLLEQDPVSKFRHQFCTKKVLFCTGHWVID